MYLPEKKVLLSYNFQLIQLIKEMYLKSFIVTISCPTNQRDSTNQKNKVICSSWNFNGIYHFSASSWGCLGDETPRSHKLSGKENDHLFIDCFTELSLNKNVWLTIYSWFSELKMGCSYYNYVEGNQPGEVSPSDLIVSSRSRWSSNS
jgi:hypothetical protein